jgi:hypothetical protein
MKICALAVSLCALVACEKAQKTTSRPLDPEDVALLHDVPAGNIALIGGNYLRMQEFMQSALESLAQRAVGSGSGAMEAFHMWSACFLEAPGPMRVVGGVAIKPALEAHFATRGITIDKVAECATKAGYPNTIDPDHKFIALTLPQPGGKSMQTGYLQLPDGALYMAMQIAPGPPRGLVPTTRANLEAATANLATTSAADDTALLDLAAKTNRSKMMWFAMFSTGTSFADKLQDAYGSLDLDAQAMHVDAILHFKEAAIATKFDQGIDQVRKLAAQMRPGLKSLLDGITLTQAGDTVHVIATTTSEQIRELTALKGR